MHILRLYNNATVKSFNRIVSDLVLRISAKKTIGPTVGRTGGFLFTLPPPLPHPPPQKNNIYIKMFGQLGHNKLTLKKRLKIWLKLNKDFLI